MGVRALSSPPSKNRYRKWATGTIQETVSSSFTTPGTTVSGLTFAPSKVTIMNLGPEACGDGASVKKPEFNIQRNFWGNDNGSVRPSLPGGFQFVYSINNAVAATRTFNFRWFAEE